MCGYVCLITFQIKEKFPAKMSSSDPILKTAHVMSQKLPLGKTYACRKDAMAALTIAVFEAGRHGFMVDDKHSGNRRAVTYCTSLFRFPEGRSNGKKVCILNDTLEGFLCEQLEGESVNTYVVRRNKRKEEYAISKGYCGFKAILNRISGREMENSRSLKKNSTDSHHAEVIEAELFSQTLAENNFVW